MVYTSNNLGQNLLRQYKNAYFLWRPPHSIAMLFAAAQEMHTWAVKA